MWDFLEPLQHAGAGDCVIRADTIDRQNGAGRVGLGSGHECVDYGPCSCPGGQGKLMRLARSLEIAGKDLGEGAGHHPSQKIADD